MRATPKAPRQPATKTCETAVTTATPAQGDRLQKRQLERSVSWTGREGCGFFGTGCA